MGFAVGDRCTVDGYAPEGTVRFVGDHHEKLKPRIGVEFDEEVEKGKGGTFAGHEYFAGKKKCCLLVLPKKVIEAIPSAADIPTTTSEAGAAEAEDSKFTDADVGKRCTVKGEASEGTIRFVGLHHKTGKPRCGVEFDDPVEKGKAGKWGPQQYFECPPGHGLLVIMSKVKIVEKKKKKASAKKAKPETAGGPVDYDSMKRLKLIKLLKGWGVDYSHIPKEDVDALRALAKSSDPDATASVAAPAPAPSTEPDQEVYDNAEATEVAAPEEEGGEMYGASDPIPPAAEPEPEAAPASDLDQEVYDNAEATEVAAPEEEGGEMYGASDPIPPAAEPEPEPAPASDLDQEVYDNAEATEVAAPEEEGGEMYGASEPAPASDETNDGGDAPAAEEAVGGTNGPTGDGDESGEVNGTIAGEPVLSPEEAKKEKAVKRYMDDDGLSKEDATQRYEKKLAKKAKAAEALSGATPSEKGLAQRKEEGEDAQAKLDKLNADVAARKEAEAAAAEARRAKKEDEVKKAEEAEVERVRMLKLNTKQRIAGAAEARTEMMLAELLAGTPSNAGAEVLKPAHLWTGTLRDRNFTSSRPHKDRKFTAQNARFNSKSGWVANTAVDEVFLQIDFEGLMLISHILTRGVKGEDFFTKEFSLSYSANGVTYTPFTADGSEAEDADPQIFKANSGTDDLAIVDLPRPLATRFLRICPVASGDEPGMRVDVFARPVGEPLGLANGTFPNASITTSSEKVASLGGSACRLPTQRTAKSKGMPTAWQASETDAAPWITFTLGKGELHLVTAVAVQGRHTLRGQWVKEFEIGINDGINPKKWQMYSDDFGNPITFTANCDRSGIAVVAFDKPQMATSVRLFPKTWENACAMRAEVYTVKVGGRSGIEDGSIPDAALYASNSYSESTDAHQCRLNGGGKEGGWACNAGHGTISNTFQASVVDSGHAGEGSAPHEVKTRVDEVQAIENTAFLQVDLGEVRQVNGVVVQGRGAKFTHYVKTFRLAVSVDGDHFLPCTSDDGDGIFMGNENANTPMVRQVAPAVAARFVRFTPISWHQRAAMRVEVISKSFGTGVGVAVDGKVADDRFQSTTEEPTETSLATNARLHSAVAWKPEAQDENQFVEVDLDTPHQINAIILQGSPDAEEWVASYRLELSKNGADWWAHSEVGYVKVFPGITEANATVASPVNADCVAQYVRICPMTWNTAIAMRVEIIGEEEAGIGGQANTLSAMVDDDDDFGNAAEAESGDEEDFANPWGITLASTGDRDQIGDNGTLAFVQNREKRRMSGVFGFDDEEESFGFGGA